MDIFDAGSADTLFNIISAQSYGLETLSNQALSNGITKYQNKDFKGAAADFKRAFGLSPYSDYAYEATQYASMAYQALGNTNDAIKVYQEAITVNSTDDRLHLDLGNLLYGQKRYGEAITEYEEAVRLYDDSTNRFSLGQAYLKTGRYRDAEYQFEKIVDRGGLDSRNGYFGLGQTYKAEGKFQEAIAQFERAISKDRDFDSAYIEMGYTYADAGEIEKAEQIRKELEYISSNAAATLSSYIYKNTQPELMFAYSDSSFKYYMKPNSQLSIMDSYLANTNSSKTVAIKFQFSKEMSREEVENVFNWSIKRSTEPGAGMLYNFGRSIPATEVKVAALPLDVYYDENNFTATVYVNLSQNENGDGTIDPSHIVFAFTGKDADGNEMNVNYDQFMGFSGSF